MAVAARGDECRVTTAIFADLAGFTDPRLAVRAGIFASAMRVIAGDVKSALEVLETA